MIPCPECGYKLKTYKRIDEHKDIRAFIVECSNCGYLKYLKRNVSLFTAWKAGYKTGRLEATKEAAIYTWFYVWLAFTLGALITLAVVNFTKMLAWRGLV